MSQQAPRSWSSSSTKPTQVPLPHFYEYEWRVICQKLTPFATNKSCIQSIHEFIQLVKELDQAIRECHQEHVSETTEELESSTNYHFHNLSFLFKKDGKGELKFCKQIFPNIVKWALQVQDLIPEGYLPILEISNPCDFCLSRRKIRSVLSCAFLCLFRKRKGIHHPKCHDFEFGLFLSVACSTFLSSLINYFDKHYEWEQSLRNDSILDEVMIIERRVLQMNSFENSPWMNDQRSMIPLKFVSGKIQDNLDTLMVDFANCMIGGHVLSGAVAQEEIMFAEIPELFISILVCPQMQPNETIRLVGWQRYSNIKGYIRNMSFEDYEDKQPIMVENVKSNQLIAMDALQGMGHMQFQKEYMTRDLLKAVCGFALKSSDNLLQQTNGENCEYSKVLSKINDKIPLASGFWGCGMFGNDRYLKVIQSWLAATICDRPLIYIHTFSPNDAKIEEEFNTKVVPAIVERSVKLRELLSYVLMEFPKEKREHPELTLFEAIQQKFGR
ncbi:hypothetical protein FDP41_004212 [Naegleria fowleri]|uniref:poly(ADP-ribose) glycohydrolase n=1 Tax=Naegleria fowleri TaxID=5763 RepID=A0A6A5BIW7_NAEFO|nr:uncharacterized protein FDP41_004212 [Naegleria fowleri]KAF0976917.1 hypothetical protein FDP41_004212 [Naegleria fowleri]CAG4718074.1 unnamed protein product [Naegleria fowleri]